MGIGVVAGADVFAACAAHPALLPVLSQGGVASAALQATLRTAPVAARTGLVTTQTLHPPLLIIDTDIGSFLAL